MAKANDDREPAGQTARAPAGKGDEAREARLAVALRANLRRRKAADQADPHPPGERS